MESQFHRQTHQHKTSVERDSLQPSHCEGIQITVFSQVSRKLWGLVWRQSYLASISYAWQINSQSFGESHVRGHWWLENQSSLMACCLWGFRSRRKLSTSSCMSGSTWDRQTGFRNPPACVPQMTCTFFPKDIFSKCFFYSLKILSLYATNQHLHCHIRTLMLVTGSYVCTWDTGNIVDIFGMCYRLCEIGNYGFSYLFFYLVN